MNESIIEVSIGPRDGEFTYRLRPTNLDTQIYGRILASIVLQIAQMFAIEGAMDAKDVAKQIETFMLSELANPNSHRSIHLLQ
jgi:hypothetical protein